MNQSVNNLIRTTSGKMQLVTLSLILLFSFAAASQASESVTQNFDLKPGWNAIYLEVQPVPNTPQSVFSGVPVESVWTWSERSSSVQFLLDPSELEWNQQGWLGYRTDPVETMLTKLFAITANRAYLVKLKGAVPVTLSVSGQPSTARINWVPQAYNLTGFHLDPAASLTLGDLLADSPAHAGEAIYAFNQTSQQWKIVSNPSSHAARAGEAYWIFSAQASSFEGPWSVDINTSDGLDFGSSLNKQVLTFQNKSNQLQTLNLTELSGSNVGLLFQTFDSTNVTYKWLPLSGMGAVQLPVGGSATVVLGVERQGFASAAVSSVLEINNGNGSRLLVPVRAVR
jgi:hypothetical protein